jgi:BarA-like signal transduction histidine kinase
MTENRTRNLTADEKRIIQSLSVIWNLFLKLPEIHPSDADEFMQAIHAAQNIVLSRPSFEWLNTNNTVEDSTSRD